MSSEHVEVLERLRGVLEHGKMGDKCLIAPDLVTAAIAALSAPQPPAEAQPVAWEWEYIGVDQYPRGHKVARSLREMDPTNPPYPETWRPTRPLIYGDTAPPSAPVGAAEDMVLDAIERRRSSAPVGVEAIKSAIAELDALRNAMFKTYAAAANGADKTKLIRLIEAERDAYESHYSLPKLQEALAAQQPAPVAPVGVEGRAREAVALALDERGHHTEADNVRNGIDLDYCRDALSIARAALAQQPPAEAQPVAWQFQDREGKWHGFMDERHRQNTIADGSWPVRALYAAPPSAPDGAVHDALQRDIDARGVAEIRQAELDALTKSAPSAPVGVDEAMLRRMANSWLFDGYETGDPKIDEPTHHRASAKSECAQELLDALAQQPAAVDGAVGTITRVGSFEVQEHRIDLDPEFDERLNHMPEGTVVRLYAAPVRDLTQQQLAVASSALELQQGGRSDD